MGRQEVYAGQIAVPVMKGRFEFLSARLSEGLLVSACYAAT